jgi:hypothetical protein
MSVPSAGPAAPALMQGLRRLLRPLVRLLIQRGITFPALADLLRELYIDVARHDLLGAPRAQTDSRISLLTGVHRKEIRRQRLIPPAAEQEPETLSLSSQIIARWLAGPPWSGADGVPLPLLRSAAADGPSFDTLVASVTRDVRPRAVLDSWLAEGVARLDAEGRVVLNAAAYLPRPGSAGQLHYFARNLHDHIAAAAANVVAEERPPFLDRSVHYDRLAPEDAARLATLARTAAERLLVEVNRAALAMLRDEVPPSGPTRRVNLGVYLYAEDEPPEGGAQGDGQGGRP